jgi:predicted nucleic acid-binding protein
VRKVEEDLDAELDAQRIDPPRASALWIACHALAERATLVTDNTREF